MTKYRLNEKPGLNISPTKIKIYDQTFNSCKKNKNIFLTTFGLMLVYLYKNVSHETLWSTGIIPVHCLLKINYADTVRS